MLVIRYRNHFKTFAIKLHFCCSSRLSVSCAILLGNLDYQVPSFEQNLVELESSMLYTKIQPQSFLCSGEEDFQEILPHIDIAPSCSIARNHLNKMVILPFRQKARVKSGENCSSSLREEGI